MALHIWVINAILALGDRQRAILARGEALVPILLSGGRLEPKLYSIVKYSGPYEQNHSITSNYRSRRLLLLLLSLVFITISQDL